MRRRLWLLLALGAVVIAAVLAAAPRFLARGRAGADQGVTITFRFPEELAGPVERLVGAFHQEHPRIRVLPVPVPGDPARRRESLEREMADLNTVETDLFAVELSWLPAWHAAGWARSLEPLGADQLTEAFVDQAAAAVRFSDGTYGLPWVLEPSLLYYRRDLIEGAGLDPPESWGDVVRLSRQFMDSGAVRWGLVWAGTPPEHLARLFVELVWANGGDLVQDGQVAVARTPAREALAFLRDLIHTHRVSPPAALDGSLAGVRRALQDGDPLMVHHPPALWRTAAERQAGAERWGVALWPPGPQGTAAVTSVDGWALVLHPQTPRLEAAWTLARWLVGPGAQQLLARETGRLPALVAPYHEPGAPERQPFLSTMYTLVASSGRPLPAFDDWPAVADAVARHVRQAVTGQRTPEEALERLAQELERLIPPQARRTERDTPIGLQRRTAD